ncbi:MAG: DNA-directed RNA polymerase subunit beta [bacterium]|nr:DNA-directed RNA polymerase subunit beta [bacterium]
MVKQTNQNLQELGVYPYYLGELNQRFSPSGYKLQIDIPDLLSLQKESYDIFLGEKGDKKNSGIHEVLSSLVFEVPGRKLEYLDFQIDPPRYTPEECKIRELTYSSIMKVKFRLTIFEDKTNEKPKEIREDWVYFGEIPRMSPRCSFIIAGTEKVIVNQLHKSPGVYFEYDKYKMKTTLKFVPVARIVPYKGMWIDFDFDLKDILHVRLRKKKRINAWIFLRAIGLDLEDLLPIYEVEEILLKPNANSYDIFLEIKPDVLRYKRASLDYNVGVSSLKKGGKFTLPFIRELTEKDNEYIYREGERYFLKVSEEKFDPTKRKNYGTHVLAKNMAGTSAGQEIDPVLLNEFFKKGIYRIPVVWYDDVFISGSIVRTYREMERKHKVKTQEDAAVEFYRRTRPGEPTDPKLISEYVRGMFMKPDKFNLSRVGRIRIVRRLGLDFPIEIRIDGEGKIFKSYNRKLMRYQVLSQGFQVGDTYLNEGLRMSDEYLDLIEKEKVEWIPISDRELFEYSTVEDILDEKGRVLVSKSYNINKDNIGELIRYAKTKGGISFRAYWYPEGLTYLDIVEVIRYLFDLRAGKPDKKIDDVDNLANRRVRSVGELCKLELQRGIERIRKTIYEKLQKLDLETKGLRDIVNFKPAASALREFFAMGQLVQFLDNTNPLSELTHKRRLSALGTGGLRRETAGIEARDVHSSHYGKICPVETPEGQNVGLITSMAIFSKIDELGLLQTPYRKVQNGYVTDKVEYLSAIEEEKFAIAPWGVEIDKEGRIVPEYLPARVGTEIKLCKREDINYIDAVPFQILGVSASLIPFFEHDDSNRALMGANMQRQAVPLISTEAPLVGTGLEGIVAKNALAVITAKHSGWVKYVDSSRIVIEIDDPEHIELKGQADIYNLVKWARTNQSTCLYQRPIVRLGEYVKAGQVIADGSSTAGGELALGKNILVAIMSWRGYNFEDSIVISERLVYDDVFTSVHLEELSVDVRETKYGPEETTRDLSTVSQDLLVHLDEDGIVREGVFVNPGDILVGKLTPVPEVPLTPEERLIKSIFAKSPESVRENFLRCPPDIKGIVIGVHIHYRKNIVKDQRIKDQEEALIAKVKKDMADAVEILRGQLWENMRQYILGIRILSTLKIDKDEFSENDQRFREAFVTKLKSYKDISNMIKFVESLRGHIDDFSIDNIKRAIEEFSHREEMLKKIYEDKISEIKKGEELPPGVLKRIRIMIASKRKVQVGDKFSGRHGNKGVVSVILPVEDMPFMPDGTPIDMIMSPLGIPSRMNVGQLLELQLGWISKELGKKIGEIASSLRDQYIRENSGEIKKKIKEFLTNGVQNQMLENFFKYVDEMDSDALVKFLREAQKLGVRFGVSPFISPKEEEIRGFSKILGIPESSAVDLRDGITGDYFGDNITVGVMYILKLVHMVEDKIHSRSTGPYSLITQQPLGGKSRGGGQRFGEMEVWALEAYGASYTLQEMLSVKSDDISGRERIIHNIIEGKPIYEPSIPESFLVLVKELQSMGFDIELLSKRDIEEMKMKKEEEETQDGSGIKKDIEKKKLRKVQKK